MKSTEIEGEGFASFRSFYPFYLSQHRNLACRRLHVAGSLLVILLLATAVLSRHWALLLLLPVAGYGFAWAGHLFFEKNRPATFKYPLYSLAGDYVMLFDIITGRLR